MIFDNKSKFDNVFFFKALTLKPESTFMILHYSPEPLVESPDMRCYSKIERRVVPVIAEK